MAAQMTTEAKQVAHTPGPKASARKSCGEYKAVVIHPDGRTEILGKRERPLIWRGREALPGGPTHFVRGKTFATRDEAVTFAQRTIDLRAQKNAEYMAQFNARRAALSKAGAA